jgi:hypothetical protein
MRLSQIRCPIPMVRTTAVLLLTAVLAACSANGKLATPGTSSDTGGSGTNTGGGTTTSGTTTPTPTVTVSVNPQVVTPGGTSTITWTTTNATSCEASGSWSGTEPANNATGVTTAALTTVGTYTYALTCTGPGGSGSGSQQIFVGAVGAPAVNLTITPAAIQPGDSATVTWSSTNSTSCTATGGTGSDGWSGTLAIQNATGLNTGAIATAGQYSYTLTCAGPGGTGSASQNLTVATSAPPAPPAITFSANPTLLAPGGSITLTWNAANATSCTASGGSGSDNWTGTEPVTSSGTVVGPIATAGNYTYTLTCTGNGGTNSQSANVLVTSSTTPPTVTVDMSVSPQTITAGQSAVLSWTSTNAASCLASGSWSGAEPTTGSAISTGTLSTAGLYSYTLACTGPAGSASSTATVTVNPAAAAVTNFAANPTTIPTGQSTSLSWATTDATSCTAGGGTGSDGWTGSEPTSSSGQSVGPFATAGNYTYNLTCTGPGGTSIPSSVTVTVTSGGVLPLPTITAFVAVPTTIQVGQSTTFTWAAINATSCTATGGSGNDQWSGSEPIASVASVIGPLNTAGSYTYTLTCTGPGGSSSASNVTITVGAATPAPTIGLFLATPSSVQVGQSTTLTWVTVNAASCAATGGATGDGWAGSTEPPASLGTAIGPYTAAGVYTYTLTCTGVGGTSAPLSTTVTVTSGPPPAAITSFTVTPSAIQIGQSISIAWTTTNATTCTGSGGTVGDLWALPLKATSSTGTTITPLLANGPVTYTLTCSGTGGTSAPSSATVTVSTGAAPATISGLTANPLTITTGQTTSLSWTSANAATCLATGGALLDGWAGVQPTSSTGVTVGPILIAGSYTYTLTCTGTGGISQPSSVVVTVVAPTPAATLTSFSVTPSTITAGQSTVLSWTTANATSCVASGGSGSDGWSGAQSTANVALTVGPIAAAGTYTYTLTCTGPGGTGAPGTATLTVNPAPPGAPVVSLTVNGSTSASIQPGGSLTFKWSATNATTCAASGGTGTDGWVAASVATTNTGLPIGPISVAGIYTYTLSCVGAGGTGHAAVIVTVVSSSSQSCGLPSPSVALLSPTASPTGGITGLCLAGCSVTNLPDVTDSNLTNFAAINLSLGVAATGYIRVTDSTTTYPAGREAGFLVVNPAALLNLTALQNVTVRTLLNGTVQDTATTSNLLTLQALGLLSNPNEGFVGFKTTKPFNAVEVDLGSLASVLGSLDVYNACVSLQ